MLACRALACNKQFVEIRHCGGDCIAVACFPSGPFHSDRLYSGDIGFSSKWSIPFCLPMYIVVCVTLVQFQVVRSILTNYRVAV